MSRLPVTTAIDCISIIGRLKLDLQETENSKTVGSLNVSSKMNYILIVNIFAYFNITFWTEGNRYMTFWSWQNRYIWRLWHKCAFETTFITSGLLPCTGSNKCCLESTFLPTRKRGPFPRGAISYFLEKVYFSGEARKFWQSCIT